MFEKLRKSFSIGADSIGCHPILTAFSNLPGKLLFKSKKISISEPSIKAAFDGNAIHFTVKPSSEPLKVKANWGRSDKFKEVDPPVFSETIPLQLMNCEFRRLTRIEDDPIIQVNSSTKIDLAYEESSSSSQPGSPISNRFRSGPYQLLCIICGHYFNTEHVDDFVNHMTKEITKFLTFRCSLCPMDFDRQDDLKEHSIRYKHPIIAQPIQEKVLTNNWLHVYCMIAQNRLFKKHQRDEMVKDCRICEVLHGRAMIGRLLLTDYNPLTVLDHLCYHAGYIRYKCELCNNRFGNPFASLEKVSKTHARPNVSIDLNMLYNCSISYPIKEFIEPHLENMHPEYAQLEPSTVVLTRYMYVENLEKRMTLSVSSVLDLSRFDEKNVYTKEDFDYLMEQTADYYSDLSVALFRTVPPLFAFEP